MYNSLFSGQPAILLIIINQMLHRLAVAGSSKILAYLPMLLIIYSIWKDGNPVAPTPCAQVPPTEERANMFQNCQISSFSYCIRWHRLADELQIQLIDYKNFAIYKRVYTNSDIGEQINRRASLDDIANVLRFARQSAQLGDEFGKILISPNGEELMMVEDQGILNVFVGVSTISGRQIARSRLNLFKIRIMKDAEIFQVRLEIHQKLIASLYEPRLQQLQQDNRNLYGRILSLQQTCLSFNKEHKAFSSPSDMKTPQNQKPNQRKPNENIFHVKF